jgi:RimJ/RimL family protein N-acetyltransferase
MTGDNTSKYVFKVCTENEIRVTSGWHKDPSIGRWIFIDDWNAYFKAVKDDPDYFLLAAYEGAEMVAEIAAEKKGNELAVSVIVDPRLHGKGIGRALLLKLCDEHTSLFGTGITSISAYINPENTASRRCFEKAGFVYIKNDDDGEMQYSFDVTPKG